MKTFKIGDKAYYNNKGAVIESEVVEIDSKGFKRLANGEWFDDKNEHYSAKGNIITWCGGFPVPLFKGEFRPEILPADRS